MSYVNLEKEVIEYITDIFRGNADGHDLNHSIRVYKNAMFIMEKYPNADRLVVALAALLHDVDDHKLFNTENNENARSFLKIYMAADDKDNDFINIPDGLIEELPFSDEEAVNMILREFAENTSVLSGESNG